MISLHDALETNEIPTVGTLPEPEITKNHLRFNTAAGICFGLAFGLLIGLAASEPWLQLQRLRAQLNLAKIEVSDVQSNLVLSQNELRTIADKDHGLVQRASELAAKESDLANREKALTQREHRLTVWQRQTTYATNLSPGSYVVGYNLAPGAYRASIPVTSLCYARLTDASGQVLDNWSWTSGQPAITIPGSSGANLELGQGCPSWHKT